MLSFGGTALNFRPNWNKLHFEEFYYNVTVPTSYQGRNQEFFWTGEVSWDKATSINFSSLKNKRKALQKKISSFFS